MTQTLAFSSKARASLPTTTASRSDPLLAVAPLSAIETATTAAASTAAPNEAFAAGAQATSSSPADTAAPAAHTFAGYQEFCFSNLGLPTPPYERFAIAPDGEIPLPPLPIRNVTLAQAQQAPHTSNHLQEEQQLLRLHWNELWRQIYDLGPLVPTPMDIARARQDYENATAFRDICSIGTFCTVIAFYCYIVMVFGGMALLMMSPVVFGVYLAGLVVLTAPWIYHKIVHAHYQNRREKALYALLCNDNALEENAAVEGLRRLGYTVEYQRDGTAQGNPEYIYLYSRRLPTHLATTSLQDATETITSSESATTGIMSTLTRFVQRNGYLRVQTYHMGDAFVFPDPSLAQARALLSSLPDLVEFESLNAPVVPYEHETQSSVWTLFWSSHCRILRRRVALSRCFSWSLALCVIPMVATSVGPVMGNIIIAGYGCLGMMASLLVAMIVMFFLMCPCCGGGGGRSLMEPTSSPVLPAKHTWALEYKRPNKGNEKHEPQHDLDELLRRGYYWESRDCVCGPMPWWMPLQSQNGHHVHYFYLFPPQPQNTLDDTTFTGRQAAPDTIGSTGTAVANNLC